MVLGRGFVTNATPTITVPGAQSATSNVAITITGTSINDADSNPQTVTISTNQSGTISLASTTGLTGAGNGTNSLSYSGSLTDINTALAALAYIGVTPGTEIITIGTNDGAGGTDSKTISVTVSAPGVLSNNFGASAFAELAFAG